MRNNYLQFSPSSSSIDSWLNPKKPQTVPFWNYFLIKFQFFILYFIAGLKKMSAEWLSGYAMSNLSYHWVFAPIRFAHAMFLNKKKTLKLNI